MDKQTVYVGKVAKMVDGHLLDDRREVRFIGERLGQLTKWLEKPGGDPIEMTFTLYRNETGQLSVHVRRWSDSDKQPTIDALYEATQEDFQPGGKYRALGVAVGFDPRQRARRGATR